MQGQNHQGLAIKVSVVTILINIVLSAGKLIAGVVAGSGAMISDAVHSASDVLSTIVVIVGMRMAGKISDHDHQYGHERMECIAAIILAVILFATGLGIGYDGVLKIIGGAGKALQAPKSIALVAAVASIVVKEWMYWYTRAAAKKLSSGALMADAWHHRSDALSSVGSFAGILGARMGYPVLDPIASVVICIFILKAAYDIMSDGFAKMVDKACDPQVVEEMKALILSHEGVVEIDLIRTRLFGSKIYVDIEIGADGSLSLEQAHHIAQEVHDEMEQKFSNVKHCMVHVNPKKIME